MAKGERMKSLRQHEREIQREKMMDMFVRFVLGGVAILLVLLFPPILIAYVAIGAPFVIAGVRTWLLSVPEDHYRTPQHEYVFGVTESLRKDYHSLAGVLPKDSVEYHALQHLTVISVYLNVYRLRVLNRVTGQELYRVLKMLDRFDVLREGYIKRMNRFIADHYARGESKPLAILTDRMLRLTQEIYEFVPADIYATATKKELDEMSYGIRIS